MPPPRDSTAAAVQILLPQARLLARSPAFWVRPPRAGLLEPSLWILTVFGGLPPMASHRYAYRHGRDRQDGPNP